MINKYFKCYQGQQYKDYVIPDKDVPPDIPTPPPPNPSIVVRKNQANMTDEEKDRFKNAIEQLIQSGFYSPHVNHHENMSHRMHGSMSGAIGFQRFLPWHRVFLDRLEEALRTIDDRVFIPYWKWVDDRNIPDWVSNFTPTGITTANGNPINITRNPGVDTPNLPTRTSIEQILALSDWTNFTTRLEGMPFGAHNMVHVWVGGTMGSVPTAPADPLFWMHHAEVDRQWHIWQQDNPGKNPILSGANAVLDPWPETVEQVLKTSDVGYIYEEQNSL